MSTAATIESPETKVDVTEIQSAGDAFSVALSKRKAETAATPENNLIDTKPPAEEAKPTEKPVEKKPDEAKPKATPLDPIQSKAPAATDDDAELTKALAELPDNAPPKVKSSHAILRKGYEREHARVKELTAQLEEAKSKTPSSNPDIEARLKAAEERAQQREAELERVAFERSPKFQQFLKASEDELTVAKSYIEGSEIDPSVIDLAASAKGAKRIEHLTNSGMEAPIVSAILSHLARNDSINRERTAAQENWKGTHAQWESEQRAAQEKQEAMVRQHEEKVFTDVVNRLSKEVPAWGIMEDNEDWTRGRNERYQLAKDAWEGKLPLEKTQEIMLRGVVHDITEASRAQSIQRINELMEENARLKAASPGAASSALDRGATSTGDPMRDAAANFDANLARRRG
jgi:hypothetical protein